MATRSTPSPAHRRAFWPKRVGLAALMALASLNIWTGSPLLALWVGSKVVGGSGLSMGAVGVVVVVLAVLVLALASALGRLGARYDELTGRPPPPRQPAPWLRSMRAERDRHAAEKRGLTALERLLVVTVVLAVSAFEVWFFFFSGSPIGSA